MKTNRKNTQGFTLIEVLVALAIFAIGLLAVLGMEFFAIAANSLGNQLTEATMLADSRLANFGKMSFLSPQLTAGTHLTTDTSSTGRVYADQWVVTDYDLTGDTVIDYKKIAVTISWTDASGRARSYDYTNTKCNPSLVSNFTSKGIYFYYCAF